jgi:hypothetical protein
MLFSGSMVTKETGHQCEGDDNIDRGVSAATILFGEFSIKEV